MTIEQMIEQIRSKHPEISKDEIAERLKIEKHRTNGFISEDTLMRMIAIELGMKTENRDCKTPVLSMADLVPGLRDVTVAGRVVAVLQPREFNGNRKGKLASFLIADESGIARVVTWNDKTELVESGSVKTGHVLRISHAYTKEGRGGRVELHVGEKCSVEVSPSDLQTTSYPTISRFATKINQIALDQENKKLNVIGTAEKLFPVSAFERNDSSPGKMMRLILADETGEISVVVWNEKVDELQAALKEGARLQIVHARVKKTLEHKIEVHVDSDTYVGTFRPDEEFLKISSIKEGLARVNLDGEVITKPMIRDVKTFRHEIVRLASFELKDDTGRIWISAWGKHADAAGNLKIGDRIILKNGHVRKGFGDQLEISTRDDTNMATTA